MKSELKLFFNTVGPVKEANEESVNNNDGRWRMMAYDDDQSDRSAKYRGYIHIWCLSLNFSLSISKYSKTVA